MSDNPFTDGQQFSAARLNSMYNAHQNNGVLTGLDASTSTNAFDVDVSSGEVFLNDSVVSASATTVSHSTSDPEDRIDLITVDSNGTVSITQGSPAATSGEPVAPDIPTDEVLVSLVYVRGGSSEILSGDIFNDYKTVLTESIPDLEANTARVETAPSSSTDVVRKNEADQLQNDINDLDTTKSDKADVPDIQLETKSGSLNATSGTTLTFSGNVVSIGGSGDATPDGNTGLKFEESGTNVYISFVQGDTVRIVNGEASNGASYTIRALVQTSTDI